MKNWIIAAVIGFALYISNPSEYEFHSYAQEKIAERTTATEPIQRAMTIGLFSQLVIDGTYRRDYLIFSRYTVHTTGFAIFVRYPLPLKIEVIGIAGFFIPLTNF
jgi:hypothetical protein